MYTLYTYVPEPKNIVLSEVPLLLLHVITEVRLAPTMCNIDTSTGTPSIIVLFVSMAVTVPLIIRDIFTPGILSEVNCRASPCPIYSVLLQARIKSVNVGEPLIVQVKLTSLLIQASSSCGSNVVNS